MKLQNISFFVALSLFLVMRTSAFGLQDKSTETDSLFKVLLTVKEDTLKADVYISIGNALIFHDPEKAKLYVDSGLAISKKHNYTFGISNGLQQLGSYYETKGDVLIAREYYKQSLKLWYGGKGEYFQYKRGIAMLYILQNMIMMNELSDGLNLAMQISDIADSIDDDYLRSRVNKEIGLINYRNGNMEGTIKNFNKVLEYYRKTKEDGRYADMLNDLGMVYMEQRDFKKAIMFFEQCIETRKKQGNKVDLAGSFNNLGIVYYMQGEFDLAEKHLLESIRLKEGLDDQLGLSSGYTNLGELYMVMGRYSEALDFAQKGMITSKNIQSVDDVSFANEILSGIYERMGQYDSAYFHYFSFQAVKDSIWDANNRARMSELQKKYEFEKNRKEIEKLNNEEKIHQIETAANDELSRKNNLFKYGTGASCLLLITILIIIIKSRKKKKTQMHELINQQKIVTEQTKEIQAGKIEIEEKSKQIHDSIEYASGLQNAILPSLEVSEVFSNGFILYKQRDVVGGDFYWMEENDNFSYAAVADCTGHGVPGGFISMMGSVLINEVYNSRKKIFPGDILTELNELLQTSFLQSSGEVIHDGMDISFVALDKKRKQLHMAGANNPIYVVSRINPDSKTLESNNKLVKVFKNETHILTEYLSDKQPIGKYISEPKPFRNRTIKVKNEDSIYLFSDGYADQFGGPAGKKFKYAPFKQLILSLQNEEMSVQKKILNESFELWKGSKDQVDDVCIMGIKV